MTVATIETVKVTERIAQGCIACRGTGKANARDGRPCGWCAGQGVVHHRRQRPVKLVVLVDRP